MSLFSDHRLPRGRHGMAPEAVAENRHWRLLGAAAEVFAERGFAGTTSLRVVSRAAVSSSTFYAHFDDVYELLQSCFEVAAESVFDIASSACSSQTDTDRGNVAAVERLLDFCAAEAELSALLGLQAAVALPAILAKRECLIERLGGLVRSGEPQVVGASSVRFSYGLAIAAAFGLVVDRVADAGADRSALAAELCALFSSRPLE